MVRLKDRVVQTCMNRNYTFLAKRSSEAVMSSSVEGKISSLLRWAMSTSGTRGMEEKYLRVFLGQRFSTGVPQEFLKCAILDYLVRGTCLFPLRLLN